jgi:hypothetical protein
MSIQVAAWVHRRGRLRRRFAVGFSTGVMTVSPASAARPGSRLRAFAAAVLAASVLSSGCGSSTREVTGGTPSAAKLLKSEDMYKYVGKGRAKKKVMIDLREKKRLLRAAAKRQESS